jgi:hypothetical protein
LTGRPNMNGLRRRVAGYLGNVNIFILFTMGEQI